MEGSVVLIHVLMDFTVARDAVVCRLLRARITEKAFAGSKAPVHDMNDDCFGTQPEGPSFTEIGTRTTNPLDHEIGRASCRERMVNCVVAVEVNQNKVELDEEV